MKSFKQLIEKYFYTKKFVNIKIVVIFVLINFNIMDSVLSKFFERFYQASETINPLFVVVHPKTAEALICEYINEFNTYVQPNDLYISGLRVFRSEDSLENEFNFG